MEKVQSWLCCLQHSRSKHSEMNNFCVFHNHKQKNGHSVFY